MATRLESVRPSIRTTPCGPMKGFKFPVRSYGLFGMPGGEVYWSLDEKVWVSTLTPVLATKRAIRDD